MALEQDIAEVVQATNNLTDVVDSKIQQIDSTGGSGRAGV